MHTLTRKPKQLSLTLALAVLAVGVLIAVALMAGGAPAQATADTAPGQNSGGGHAPGQQTEPEACAETPAQVVSTGHYAIFDVYWDDDHKNLVNNPCPPEIDVVAHTTSTLGNTTTTYTYSRSASDINIDSTIFHIPGNGVVVSEDSLDDYNKWPFLYDDTSDDDGNGKIDQASEVGAPSAYLDDPTPDNPESGDETYRVWSLPACHHDADDTHADAGLCIGYSATLLNPDDWQDLDFEFESIREPGLDPDDRGNVFVFYPSGETPEGEKQAIWATDNPDANEIAMEGGDYRHQPWVFSKPGRYVFAVHVKAHPELEENSIQYIEDKKPKTVTSLVRNYTFHVGALADLSVEVTAEPAGDGTLDTNNECDGNDGNCDGNLDPGERVEITVTASNAGPDQGESVKVNVALPDGLTHATATTATGTYDSATGVWSVGDLGVTDAENTATDDDPPTLTITATVADGTRGHEQTITAEIYATEHIGSSDVVELDPGLDDNSDHATVTPHAIPNDPPLFEIVRSTHEKSKNHARVGDSVLVREPDDGDTLSFGLEGDGASNFAVSSVGGAARITVADGHALNRTTNPSYDLTLTASDGLDDDGNDDSAIDHRIALRLDIIEFSWGLVTLTLQPSTETPGFNEYVTVTAHLHGLPNDHGTISYTWEERDRIGNADWTEWITEASVTGQQTGFTTGDLPGAIRYRVTVEVNDADGNSHTIGPVKTEISWPTSPDS